MAASLSYGDWRSDDVVAARFEYSRMRAVRQLAGNPAFGIRQSAFGFPGGQVLRSFGIHTWPFPRLAQVDDRRFRNISFSLLKSGF